MLPPNIFLSEVLPINFHNHPQSICELSAICDEPMNWRNFGSSRLFEWSKFVEQMRCGYRSNGLDRFADILF